MYDDVTSSRGAETRRINKIDDQMAYASKAKGSEILFDGASSGEKTGEEHLGKSDVSLIRELGREQQLRRKAQENLTKQFDKGLKHDHLLWQIRRITIVLYCAVLITGGGAKIMRRRRRSLLFVPSAEWLSIAQKHAR